jgi:putative transposase
MRRTGGVASYAGRYQDPMKSRRSHAGRHFAANRGRYDTVGLSAFATCSDGRQFQAPRPLRCHAKRLRRASRCLSRHQAASKRRQTARRRVARLHRRMRNIRSAFLHPLSTSIVRDNQTIVIEDLHIGGMLKNHHLGRAISDAGWYEFRRQLTYKCQRYGRTLLAANCFYPSSKLCCQCGSHNPTLTLADHVYECTVCGKLHGSRC